MSDRITHKQLALIERKIRYDYNGPVNAQTTELFRRMSKAEASRIIDLMQEDWRGWSDIRPTIADIVTPYITDEDRAADQQATDAHTGETAVTITEPPKADRATVGTIPSVVNAPTDQVTTRPDWFQPRDTGGRGFDQAKVDQNAPNTPNTCLLYTSPSPRDS